MEEEKKRPFSTGFVLKTTTKHMRRSIDVSIRKTFERIQEFDGDERSKEVFKTLMYLHTIRKMLDDFQAENKEAFKG
jgi:hypothetical protein